MGIEIMLEPEQRPQIVAEAFGSNSVEYAYYWLGETPGFDIEKDAVARNSIAEQTGAASRFRIFVDKGLYIPWSVQENPFRRLPLDTVPIIGKFFVGKQYQRQNYVKVCDPKNLVPTIDTPHGSAELIIAAVNDGFNIGPRVDFVKGIVQSFVDKRDFFENLGFSFYRADSVY